MAHNLENTIDLDDIAFLVNSMEKMQLHFIDCLSFMDLFAGETGRSEQYMEEKYAVSQYVEEGLIPLIKLLELHGYERAADTNEFLLIGEDAYYNSIQGAWYKSWLKMVSWAIRAGYSKSAIYESLDIENNDESMYYTTFTNHVQHLAVHPK